LDCRKIHFLASKITVFTAKIGKHNPICSSNAVQMSCQCFEIEIPEDFLQIYDKTVLLCQVYIENHRSRSFIVFWSRCVPLF
jgi:hypothetical protein